MTIAVDLGRKATKQTNNSMITLCHEMTDKLLKETLNPNTIITTVLFLFFQLCNYCSEESGHRLLMDEKRDPCYCSLTCSICVSCILSGSKKLFASGAALCYNISLYKVAILHVIVV